MSDLIDRQNAIDVLEILSDKMSDAGQTVMAQAVAVLKDLRSEEPGRKWTPVAEALPEGAMCVLTTIETKHKGKQVRSGFYYQNHFHNDNGDTWNATDKEVLAWMPLPEPWRGE